MTTKVTSKPAVTYVVPPPNNPEEGGRRLDVAKFLHRVGDLRPWSEHFGIPFDDTDVGSSRLRLVVELTRSGADLKAVQREIQEGLRRQFAVQAEPVCEGRDLIEATVHEVVVECDVRPEEVERRRRELVRRSHQSGMWEALEASLKERHADDIPLLTRSFARREPGAVRHMVTVLNLAECKLRFLLERQAEEARAQTEAQAAAEAARAQAERAEAKSARRKQGKGRRDRRQAA